MEMAGVPNKDIVSQIKHRFPGLVLQEGVISEEKLHFYQGQITQPGTNVANPQAAREQAIPDVKVLSYATQIPDWFIEPAVTFEPYHIYINGTNGIIAQVKFVEGRAQFKHGVLTQTMANQLGLSADQTQAINRTLAQGLAINSTVKLSDDLLLGVSSHDASVSIDIANLSDSKGYSYGLKTGIVHWQQTSLDYVQDRDDEVNLHLIAKDSYKNPFGMLNAEYRYSTATKDAFDLRHFSFLGKPLWQDYQLAVTYSDYVGYNDPYGTITSSYFLGQGRFTALELYNFSLFDHEYQLNRSGEKLQIYSRDYALATIYANQRYISKVRLTPGFNLLDDRLLDPGHNQITIEKTYNNGGTETETIDYFKKSYQKPDEEAIYAKIAVGQSEVDNDNLAFAALRGSYKHGSSALSLNSILYPELGDAAAELGFNQSGSWYDLTLYGLASINQERGFYSRLMLWPTSFLNTTLNYSRADARDCTSQPRFINRGCSEDINLYSSVRLPFNAYLNYAYRNYNNGVSDYLSYDSHRLSLNKNHTLFNRLVVSFNTSYEKRLSDRAYGNSEDLFVGLTFSYFLDRGSLGAGGNYNRYQATNASPWTQQSNHLSYTYSDRHYGLSTRVNQSRYGGVSNTSVNLDGNYRGGLGTLYLNSSYIDDTIVGGLTHEFSAAVNDRSYSLMSDNPIKSDTGIIFDTRAVSSDSQIGINIDGTKFANNYRLNANDQVFIPLEPGKYVVRFDGSLNTDTSLSTLYLNEKNFDLFKGDVKTIDFAQTKLVIVSFSHDFGSRNLSIEGCTTNYSSGVSHELTCSDTLINQGQSGTFIANVDNEAKTCKYRDRSDNSEMFYILKDLTCE